MSDLASINDTKKLQDKPFMDAAPGITQLMYTLPYDSESRGSFYEKRS